MIAYTKNNSPYPGYINIKRIETGVAITIRADPIVQEGSYLCGNAADRGKAGRCTPGDSRCNNYCNLAPEKGPMQDETGACTHVTEGNLAVLVLTDEELFELHKDIFTY